VNLFEADRRTLFTVVPIILGVAAVNSTVILWEAWRPFSQSVFVALFASMALASSILLKMSKSNGFALCALAGFLGSLSTYCWFALHSFAYRAYFAIDYVGLGMAMCTLAMAPFLARVKRNAFFGVRTKWSLASDEIWEKVHKVAAQSAWWVGGMSVLLSLSGWGHPLKLGIFYIEWAIGLVVYSKVIFDAERFHESRGSHGETT